MQLNDFKYFISEVVAEGKRLQRQDIEGEENTKWPFTQMQIVCFCTGTIAGFFLVRGFSDNFAGYIISFLGIFVGLFTSIVIALQERSSTIFRSFSKQNADEKYRLLKIRNYLVQFTGLTSYSIFLAIVIIILLSLALISPFFHQDYREILTIRTWNEFHFSRFLLKYFQCAILFVHRFLIVQMLSLFFTITIYSTTSYFSYIKMEYGKIADKND